MLCNPTWALEIDFNASGYDDILCGAKDVQASTDRQLSSITRVSIAATDSDSQSD